MARPFEPIEWPTVGLAAALYAAFGVLTWFHAALPVSFVAVAGGSLVALHGSLQHEVVHGHPTRWQWINEVLIFPSLWLWLPFRLYRDSHLHHHRQSILTDPAEDPESFYVDAEAWVRLPRLVRALLWVNNTLVGRLAIGPVLTIGRFLAAEIRDTHWNPSRLGAWLAHAAGAGLVVAWVAGVCAMPIADYFLIFVYPGVALTLLRSFAEHQAHPDPARRTTIVEAEAPFAVLFLNNNLHVVHHRHPRLPWYRLPSVYARNRDAFGADSGGAVYRGYRAVAAKFFLAPRQSPIHPG